MRCFASAARVLSWIALLGLMVGCTTGSAVPLSVAGPTAALHDDAARPTVAQGWLRSELYFAIADDDPASAEEAEQAWRAFLDREVSPRFPDGLSVFDAYGQWLVRGERTPSRLRSKLLVILHPDTPLQRERIDEIRLAWKRETGHRSVLWSWQPVGVSF